MPNSLGRTALAMLFAIPCAGCMSQNAMSLVPDSVRLEIAQQKAAKAPPVSVDQMLQNAGGKTVAPGKAGGKPDAAPLPLGEGPKPQTAQKASPKTAANAPRALTLHAGRSAAELFAEARALHRQAEAADLNFIDDIPNDSEKSAGGADAWRAMLAQAQEHPDPARADASGHSAADKDSGITTSSLPDRPASANESIQVKFNDRLTGLSKDDDLRVRLLRHGKRIPQTIIIGKVESAKGFEAMEKALALGRIIAEASGGNPAISYDPALSPRAAELVYVKPGAAS